MKKIKVIDLLNMIANKEYDKLPKRIIIKNREYQLKEDYRYYTNLTEYGYAELTMNVSHFQLNSDIEIIEEPILDDKERKYLSNVIAPFRDKVDHIIKWSDFENDNYIGKLECINIVFKDETMEFPCFPQGTMYKGMEAGISYSIEELGL